MFFYKKYYPFLIPVLFLISVFIIQYYSVTEFLISNSIDGVTIQKSVYLLRIILVTTSIVILAPVSEELLFRGWLQKENSKLVHTSLITFILISIIGEISKILYNTTFIFQLIGHYNNQILLLLQNININYGLQDIYDIIFHFIIIFIYFVIYLIFNMIDINLPKINLSVSIFISSLFFILFHLATYNNINIIDLVYQQYFIIFITPFLCWAAVKTNIRGAIILHSFANFSGIVLEDILLDLFPNSPLQFPASSFSLLALD